MAGKVAARPSYILSEETTWVRVENNTTTLGTSPAAEVLFLFSDELAGETVLREFLTRGDS